MSTIHFSYLNAQLTFYKLLLLSAIFLESGRAWSNCRDFQSSNCKHYVSIGYCEPESQYSEFVRNVCCWSCKWSRINTKAPTLFQVTKRIPMKSKIKMIFKKTEDFPMENQLETKIPIVVTTPSTTITTTPITTTRRTTTWLDPSCIDTKRACGAWAARGFCEQNLFVQQKCCRSCNGDQVSLTRGETTSDPATTEAPESIDRSRGQTDGAENALGLRKESERWSRPVRIRTTARTRPSTPSPTTTPSTTISQNKASVGACRDRKGRICASWAMRGFCQKNAYVQNNCCSTCRTSTTTPKPTPSTTCRDKNRHCRGWGDGGFCRFNEYVKKNCCLSCSEVNQDFSAIPTS